MVRKCVKVGLFGALAVFGSGCLAPQSDSVAGLIAAGSSATTTTTSSTGDLYLMVSTSWDTTPDSYTTHATCSIPVGSAQTTSTCAVTIPEAQLFFSNLKFTVGTSNAGSCSILIFSPYYYLGSTAAAYTPPWDTTATPDCSAPFPTDPDCYNGFAKEVVPDFPNYTGRYFLTAEGNETSYSATSPNSKHYSDNRSAANNLVNRALATDPDYAANSMQDYVVECRDQYYQLQKKITVTISDQDTGPAEDPGGPNDHFEDWSGN